MGKRKGQAADVPVSSYPTGSLTSHIICELHRYIEVSSLKKSLKAVWKDVLPAGTSIPNQTFINWLFEAMAHSRLRKIETGYDCLIPSSGLEYSHAIEKHVLLRVPCAFKWAASGSAENRTNLQTYVSAVKKFINEKATTTDQQSLAAKVEELAAKALTQDESEGVSSDSVRRAVRDIRTMVVTKLIPDIVEKISKALAVSSSESLERMSGNRYTDSKMFENCVAVHVSRREESDRSVILSYELKLKDGCDHEVKCAWEQLASKQLLSYAISEPAASKLKRFYDRIRPHGQGETESCEYLGERDAALFLLLHRYQSLFGSGSFNWHLATPTNVMEIFGRKLGVTHECFASPFNAHFPSFCSAFGDTDRAFGSVGSFFDFDLSNGGSYEAGPPYDAFVMDMMSARILESLRSCSEPLSFALVLPDWDLEGFAEMKSSSFCRGRFTLGKDEHKYVSGAQHREKGSRILVQYEGSTLIMVLQNDAAKEKWPVTNELLLEIKEAWMNPMKSHDCF